MSSLVSVIVPVYNTVEYVEECIQSILSQSYKDIELIMVNDGSTDGSGIVCSRYQHLPNVYYVEQENCGTTAARRRGVEMAYGDWILFVDSDDYLLDDAISHLVSLSDDTNIVLGAQEGYKELERFEKCINAQEYRDLIYARQITVSPCAKLYKKTLFQESTLAFANKYILGEDYLMNVRIATDNTLYVNVNHTPVYYRRNVPTSTVHTHNLNLDYCQQICDLADSIVLDAMGDIPTLLKMKQRMVFFNLTLPDTGFQSDPNHPFVQDIKRCMNEAKVWRPMDRWLLSVSSPWAVKTVWNLRKITTRLAHPSMIPGDIKRLLNRY